MSRSLALLVALPAFLAAACGGHDVECFEQEDGQVVCIDQADPGISHREQAGGGCGGAGKGPAHPLENLTFDALGGRTATIAPVQGLGNGFCSVYGWSALCPLQGSFEMVQVKDPDPTAKDSE